MRVLFGVCLGLKKAHEVTLSSTVPHLYVKLNRRILGHQNVTGNWFVYYAIFVVVVVVTFMQKRMSA